MLPIVPMMGISCGLLAIFGGVFVKPRFAYRHRRMDLEASMVAEKAAQYAAPPNSSNSSNSACACWSGS